MNINPPPPFIPEASPLGSLSRQSIGSDEKEQKARPIAPVGETEEEDGANNSLRDSGEKLTEQQLAEKAREQAGKSRLTQHDRHNNPAYQLETIQNEQFDSSEGTALDSSA